MSSRSASCCGAFRQPRHREEGDQERSRSRTRRQAFADLDRPGQVPGREGTPPAREVRVFAFGRPGARIGAQNMGRDNRRPIASRRPATPGARSTSPRRAAWTARSTRMIVKRDGGEGDHRAQCDDRSGARHRAGARPGTRRRHVLPATGRPCREYVIGRRRLGGRRLRARPARAWFPRTARLATDHVPAPSNSSRRSWSTTRGVFLRRAPRPGTARRTAMRSLEMQHDEDVSGKFGIGRLGNHEQDADLHSLSSRGLHRRGTTTVIARGPVGHGSDEDRLRLRGRLEDQTCTKSTTGPSRTTS